METFWYVVLFLVVSFKSTKIIKLTSSIPIQNKFPESSRVNTAIVAFWLLLFSHSSLSLAATTINEQFTPATIDPGDSSVYKITFANTSSVVLTEAKVTVLLPNSIKLQSPINIINGCGFTVNAATPGTSVIELVNGSIPPSVNGVDGQCTFQLDVTSITPGNQTATIPANSTPTSSTDGYTAKENGISISNSTPALATLSVNALSSPTGSKTFAPSPAIVNDPITLTITLTNPNANSSLPLTSFIDTLPAGMVVANPASPTVACSGTGAVNGTVSANPGANSITLNGGTIGRNGNCIVTVKVKVNSISGTSQVLTNTVPANAIGNTRGLTSATFTRAVTVNTPIGLTKTFNPTLIPVGQPSLMTLTITNSSTSNTLPITSFTDDMSAIGVTILDTANGAPANPAVVCSGAGSTNGSLTDQNGVALANGSSGIKLNSAAAGPAGNCVITAYVTSSVDGPHVNAIPANSVINPNNYSSPAASATLTGNAQLDVTKTVTVANVAPGQWTEFSIAIRNYSGGAVTGVSFTDILPSAGGNQLLLHDPGTGIYSTDSGCIGGSWAGTNSSGTSTGSAPTTVDAGIKWLGGTIAAGVGVNPGLCTIKIRAILPANSPTGLTFNNIIPQSSITGTGNNGPVTNTNQSGVNVVSVSSGALTKTFTQATIPQGGQSTLTLTLINRTVFPLTNVNLTDNLPVGITLTSNPASTNTCGGTLEAYPNNNQVRLLGGTIPARPVASQESTCIITVKVTGSALGTYTNTIQPSNFTTAQGVTIPANVSANLTISTGLTASKSFTPTSVGPGGKSRVKLTLSNTSNIQLTGIALDDNTFSSNLTIANPPNASSSCGVSPTLVLVPGSTRAQIMGVTLASGSSCDFTFDVVTNPASSTSWSNTIPIGKITSAEGLSNTAAVTATLNRITPAISLNKSFNPVLTSGGVPSVLRIDFGNSSGAAVTGVSVTDTFPVGIEVYSVPNASTNCPGGVITAVPGDGKVSISGATVPNGGCYLLTTVTSTKFLNLTNTIPAQAITSNQGVTNSQPASASLSTLQGLGIMKSFAPAFIGPNQISRLKMRLVSSFDPNAINPKVLTGVTFTDTLPAGVVIAATPSAITDCSNGVVNAAPNTASVTVSNVTLQPGTNCTIEVNVTASSVGNYTNTLPMQSVTSNEGVKNQSAATANLAVVSAPTLSKSFANATRNMGQANALTITVRNNATIPLSGVSLSDQLPSGLVIASTPNASTTCSNGVVIANVGGNSLNLSGASIPANSTCTFRADVVGNVSGDYTNTINPNALTTDQGVTNPGSASASMSIFNAPTLNKAFSPVAITAGGISRLTLNLGNTNNSALTLSAALVDVFPAGVTIANPPNLGTGAGFCPGLVTATAGATQLTYANGATIPAGGCSIAVDVTSSTNGVVTNIIDAGQLQTNRGKNQVSAQASLAVGTSTLVPPSVSKAFSSSTVDVNASSVLTITLGNLNSSSLTLNSQFTDNLPSGLVIAATPNIGGTCDLGSITANSGGGSISYANNAIIPAGGCTITVAVTSSSAGNYTNSVPANALNVSDNNSGTLSNQQSTAAGIVFVGLQPPSVQKFFEVNTINPGDIARLTLVLTNPNTAALTLTSNFNDILPANVTVASNPNLSKTCPGTVTASGSSVTYANGSVLPAGSCSISVDVTSSTPGTYTNTVPAGALVASGLSNVAASSAKLFVNPLQPPGVSKAFSPASVQIGSVSSLSIAFSNPNAVATNLTADLVDNLPAGVVIATPSNLQTNCDSNQVVANAGDTYVTFKSGGIIPANGGCVITVDVKSNTANTYTNTIAQGSLKTTIGNNAVATSASLTTTGAAADMKALVTLAQVSEPSGIVNGVITCTATGGVALSATCTATAKDSIGGTVPLSIGVCNPTPPVTLTAGQTISCPISYVTPGILGGSDTPPESVTVTAITSSINDSDGTNNSAFVTVPIIDAADDFPGYPGGTKNATSDLSANDSYLIGSVFTPEPGGTCINGTVNISGIASYDVPSHGTCTVNYKVCAPDPNQAHCDTATMKVTATPSDMTPSFSGLPNISSPGANVTGTLVCTNVISGPNASTAIQATCDAVGVDSVGNTVPVTVSACTPTPPSNLAVGASITCHISYIVPSASGGIDTLPTSVTLTGITSSINDINSDNDLKHVYVPIIDAVDDSIGQPGGTLNAQTDLSLNDQFPPGSLFTLLPGGGCANSSISGSTVKYDVPANGSCEVNYQICAPSPDVFTCDTAKLTVTASLADVNSSVSVPNVGAPGALVSGSITCSNLVSSAASATQTSCTATAVDQFENPITVTVGACTPSVPIDLAIGATITCPISYVMPGTIGGVDSPEISVKVTSSTSATNDSNAANNLNFGVTTIIDALDDTDAFPGGTAGASTQLSLNDQFTSGSHFSLQSDPGTCPSITLNSTGIASYDVPNSGTCTVNYKVCAPAPNQLQCDNATLTVTANAADMTASVNVPAKVAPGNVVNGTITCLNTTGKATGATCSASAVDNLNVAVPVTVSNCVPATPVSLITGASIVCQVSYVMPGTMGGIDTSETYVTLKAVASAANEGNPSNDTASGITSLVDAVNDVDEFPGGTTGAVSDLASNDDLQSDVVFSIQSGTTCANASIDSKGLATYDVPPSGSCTLHYQVCAPIPDQTQCDKAELTVTAIGTDMSAALTVPDISVPGDIVNGTITCQNGMNTAIGATCTATATGNDGSIIPVTVSLCSPIPPVNLLSGQAITCQISYMTPGTLGGGDTAPTFVTVTATTGASNDSDGTNNSVFKAVPIVDAVDDFSGYPGGVTGATTDLNVNDSYPSDSNFTELPGGTCANTNLTQSGLVTYDVPPTGTCTVNYKVCAPSPNASVCDTATMTVTATPSDMMPVFSGFPAVSSPGTAVSGTLTCTNVISGQDASSATQATCSASAVDSIGNLLPVVVSDCFPQPPVDLAVGASITCSVSYTVPGDSGGNETIPVNVTLTGVTSSINDKNAGNNTISTYVPIIDAVDDSVGHPGGVSFQQTDVAGNDQFPAGSLFTLLPGGNCAKVSISGSTIHYDVPGTGSCTVNYQVCAPAPNTLVCDSATLTVIASLADMNIHVDIPANGAPESIINGTIQCSNSVNSAAPATNVTCSATAIDNLGNPVSVTVGACSPALPGNIAPGDTITCPISYVMPPPSGGADTLPSSVTVTGLTSAANDDNTANNTGNSTTTLIDAVDDSNAAPGGSTGVTSSLAGNDQYPPASLFTLQNTGSCLNAAVSANGIARYDVPAEGSCTVNYQVCAPVPNQLQCDTATLTVFADGADVSANIITPASAAPGSMVYGTLTCLNNTGTATGVSCDASAQDSSGAIVGVDVSNCEPLPPATLLEGQTVRCDISYRMPGSPGGSQNTAQYVRVFAVAGALNDSNATNNTVAGVTVSVDAVDDPLISVPSAEGGVVSILDNDALGNTHNPHTGVSGVQIPTIVNGANTTLTTATINAANQIVVPPGTAPGTYQVEYQLCVQAQPSNCDTAIASIIVRESPAVMVSDMTSTTQCTPPSGNPGVTVRCVSTCFNLGPGVAHDAFCTITNASQLGGVLGSDCSITKNLEAGRSLACTMVLTLPQMGSINIHAGTGAVNDSNGGAVSSAGNNASNTVVSVYSATATNAIPTIGFQEIILLIIALGGIGAGGLRKRYRE